MKKIALALGGLVLSASAFAGFHANPFQLAGLAYQGSLSDEGIPSYGLLCDGQKRPAVSADEVISAGIAAGYVDADAVTTGYERSVARQLRGICDDNK